MSLHRKHWIANSATGKHEHSAGHYQKQINYPVLEMTA